MTRFRDAEAMRCGGPGPAAAGQAAKGRRPQGLALSRRATLSWAAVGLAGCATSGPPEDAAPVGLSRAQAPALASGPPARIERVQALHLLNRFGYGPAPGELERLTDLGARHWWDEQLGSGLESPPGLVHALAMLPTTQGPHTGALARYARLQATALRPGVPEAERAAAARDLTDWVRQVQSEARQARVLRAVHSGRPLVESLTEFWFNHFNVFIGKETVRVTAGFFEQEAIRPHVLGRFRDLLGATARHPAMLNYLDNWRSVADGFRPALRRPANAPAIPQGPNENYARELLELHTLGSDGGYGQQDVVMLARILTGWTFDRFDADSGDAFRFIAARHDRGPKVLLGHPVPGEGREQGEWALDLLARHPATARHVARKLAIAYVADRPAAALVERLARRFSDTDGDLREVIVMLAASPEFNDPAVRGAKFKTPYQWVVSTARALRTEVSDARPWVAASARLGMPIYGCPTPDGWRDTREAWVSPEGLRLRVDQALAASRSAGPPGSGGAVHGQVAAPGLPGPLEAVLSQPARAALADLAPPQRLAVALASPDFSRR